jgi:predicted dehydrogenase
MSACSHRKKSATDSVTLYVLCDDRMATQPLIDVGLIGFGLAGRAFHAPMIHSVPGLRLAAILQRTGSSALETYPEARLVRSLEELLSINSIRLIVIATPNLSHFPLAKKCLEAGRDVVVDKPFTTTLDEARRLVALAEKLGRLLTVYQDRRWDGDFQTVQQLLSSGELGRLVRYEAHYDRFRPQLRGTWREQPGPGSGILFDLGPHLIDQALVLFGAPQAVTADVRSERDGALTDDAFDILLHYPHNMRASLHCTMLAAAPRAHFVLYGTRGSFIKHGMDPQEAPLRAGHLPGGESWGVDPEENWGTLTLSDGVTSTDCKVPTARGDYRGFYENVRDALLGLAPLAVTPAQALNVMRLLELSLESSRLGSTLAWPK